MLPPGLETPREVTLYYNSIYESLIKSGQARPFVYPWAGLGAFIALGYLLLDHRQSTTLKWLRYPVFIFVCAFQIECVWTTRAKHPAAAFGVGLLSAWGVLWIACILIINDCQSDFVRLERYRRDITITNGTIGSSEKTSVETQASNDTSSGVDGSAGSLQWQYYPSTLRNRIDWVSDVFCNFRGIGWNYQISSVPSLPKEIEMQLHGKVDSAAPKESTVSRAGIRRFSDRAALLKSCSLKLLAGYLVLDVIIVMMHNDPYFWGYTNAPAPSHLPSTLQSSYVLLKFYRIVLGLAGLYVALSEAFAMGPIFFCEVLGPDRIGVRGEPWMNPPDMFGSFRCVLDQGLAGLWGSFWHQTFRFAFETTGKKVLDGLNINRKTESGRIGSLLIAFFLSGCLHAVGSYTQLGDTRPLLGPMLFFVLQPFGIIFQLTMTKQISKAGICDRTPKSVQRVTNLVYVLVWGYFTAPLILDDFAKGGNFLFEPVAFSPLRALGFGAKDDSWYCWWDGILWWRSGKTWLDSGIAA